MKKRNRLALAMIDTGMFSVRRDVELAYTKLLALETAAGDTLMGGEVVLPDASQTGDGKAAPNVEVKLDAEGKPIAEPDNKQTPTAAEAEAAAKAEAEAKAKADAEKAGDKPAPKAPEKYDFKMPEGVVMDTALLGELEGISREFDLPQESAQKIVDLGVKLTQRFATQQADALTKAGAEWLQQTNTDKEIGGEALAQNLSLAVRVRDTFATPALRALLNESKLGNHPEIVRLFVKFGKAISEDKLVSGGAGPAADKSAANTLYPNQK